MRRSIVDSRYVLSGLLGGGGMGKVYLTPDHVLERDTTQAASTATSNPTTFV